MRIDDVRQDSRQHLIGVLHPGDAFEVDNSVYMVMDVDVFGLALESHYIPVVNISTGVARLIRAIRLCTRLDSVVTIDYNDTP